MHLLHASWVSHVTQEWDPPPDAGGGLEATGVGFTA